MHKKRNGSHGAISVFLAIILVPCMVFTCVFGDLSRVQLSMATAESAGDLALYSLLAHYDEELKEYYGLVGSCQDINEFYDVSENYFKGMLQAEGVSGEGSQLFVQYLNELRSKGYTDFLRTEISNVEITEAEKGNLGGNAALIEDGIVEFMKYRGPIQITTNLIDRFAELNFEKEIADADDNKQVVDKKQIYAEKQGELLEMAFYIYLAIRQYEKEQTASGYPSWAKYDELARNLSNTRDDLRGVTALITKYYFPGTENLRNVNFPVFRASDYHYDKEDVGQRVELDGGGEIYCMTNKILQEDILNGLEDDLEDIENAAKAFVNGCAGIPAPGEGINKVVYCLNMQQAIDQSGVVGTLSEKGDDVLKTWAKLLAAAECEPLPEGNDLPDNWKDQISDACDEIEAVYDEYLSGSGDSDYWRRATEYGQTAADTVPRVQNRSYTFNSKLLNANVTIDAFCGQIASILPEFRSYLEEQIKRLDVVINGGEITYNGSSKKVEAIDKLIVKAEEFTNARSAWGSTAGAYSTEYAKSEYRLYQGASSAAESGQGNDPEVEGEKIAAKITPESVAELKTRLVNIRADMQACLDALDRFTYGGIAVKDFTGGNQIIQAAYRSVPQTTSYSISDAETASRSYSDALISPATDSIYKVPEKNSAPNGNDPILGNATPELYRFLKQKLGEKEGEIESEIDSNKKRNDEYKSQAEGNKKQAQGIEGQYLTNKGSNLENTHGGTPVSLLTALGSVVTVAKNVANGSGDELRDQLYVCEYIMSMFSYSDFENEGKYRLALGKNENVTYNDFPYNSQAAAWEEENPREVMRNQSLTNRPIVNKNNHAHLGEVEYILYGNEQIDENLKTSYKNIFSIREMLNIVSGFCNFYSAVGTNDTARVINTIATAIATATAGIVPVPATKCVLILVLATLESAKDVQRLKAGGRVPLYKTSEEEWVCSIDGAEEAVFPDPDGTAEGPESGMYYSDYMYIFLLLGLSNESTYNSMLLRVGDLIQANMRKAQKEEGEDPFSLAKTRCYFKLTGSVRVKPLMLTLPIVNTVEGAGELREKTDWCSYKVNMIRGYS